MSENGKMIQIYLHDGSANGIKIASSTRREINAVMIPRPLLLKALKEIKELQNIGVYFLYGEDENGKQIIYAGEGENVAGRLKEHEKNKVFWDTAIAFVSPSIQNHYNKSEILFLESQSIEMIKKAERYELTNGNKGRSCVVNAWRKSDLISDIELIGTLSNLLGYPLFEAMKHNQYEDFFYCEGRGVRAKGEVLGKEFVVRKGSQMVLEPVPSFVKKHPKYVEAIKGLEKRNLIERKEKFYVFADDVSFPSASAASSIILQRPCSGKSRWRTDEGVQLKDRIKQ